VQWMLWNPSITSSRSPTLIINVELVTFSFPLLIQLQVGFLVMNPVEKMLFYSLWHLACTVLLIVN
jgi:hypothetical protein